MLRSSSPLVVYPAPFAALDAEGMPAGAVRFDPPTGRAGEVHFIGCARTHKVVERRRRADGRQSLYTTAFQFEIAPHPIPHTDYHVQRIRHGELIAADESTAKRAEVPWVPPGIAFERARFAAITRWEQQYGTRPPVESWPDLRLVAPEDGTLPSTAPAHAASMRARGVVAAATPAPVGEAHPAAEAPAAEPQPEPPPPQANPSPPAPGVAESEEAPSAVPPTKQRGDA
jgi:hypothetical protein